MAGGCYAIQSTESGAWVQRYGDGYRASATSKDQAEPFHFLHLCLSEVAA